VSGVVHCAKAPHSYEVAVSCPSVSNMTVLCYGNISGEISYACPTQIHKRQCRLGDGVQFSADDRCHLVSYTADNTTCRCRGLRDGRRRLSIGDVNPIVQEIGASVQVITTNFVETWMSAEDLNSEKVAQNYIILTTVCGLMGLCVFGFCGLFAKEKYSKKNLHLKYLHH